MNVIILAGSEADVTRWHDAHPDVTIAAEASPTIRKGWDKLLFGARIVRLDSWQHDQRVVDARTQYAPLLTPASGLRWARRKARDHAKGVPTQLHIANDCGRLICDGAPSVSKGINEPTLASEIHTTCLHVYRRDHTT